MRESIIGDKSITEDLGIKANAYRGMVQSVRSISSKLTLKDYKIFSPQAIKLCSKSAELKKLSVPVFTLIKWMDDLGCYV